MLQLEVRRNFGKISLHHVPITVFALVVGISGVVPAILHEAVAAAQVSQVNSRASAGVEHGRSPAGTLPQ